MSQQTHRGAEVLHGGLPTANRTDATYTDQRLLLGLIKTLANMWETCFCSASTLDECIKLGHGPVWISSWIVFQKFVVPWQWADFLHLRDMLKSRNRLYHWYEINLTEQTPIIVSTAAGSRSYHQWNSNLTGQPVCDPPTFKFLPNKYC